MAHVATASTPKLPTNHSQHHGLPPFAIPMLVLFGTYLSWLLVTAIVLYIIV